MLSAFIKENSPKSTAKISKKSHLAHPKSGQHYITGTSFFPRWVDSCSCPNCATQHPLRLCITGRLIKYNSL